VGFNPVGCALNFASSVFPMHSVRLVIGGMEWEMAPGPGSKGTGDLWAEWLEMKGSTVWGFLPNLEVSESRTIGSEIAILQYLARQNPALAGESEDDFYASNELLFQAEELYLKFAQKFPTIMAADKSPEEFNAFISSADKTVHSSQQGLQVYLGQFENFPSTDGKFTTSGITIGEIKLFSTLHLLMLVKADALDAYPKLSKFMDTFRATDKVKAVLDGTASNMAAAPLAQYFIAPP